MGDGDVRAEAAPYWALRSAVVPLQLLNMAAAGVLQVGAEPLPRAQGFCP